MNLRFQFHEDGTIPIKGEIFVFGSNLAGIHGAGAAMMAKLKFGAKDGRGVGLSRDSYAIPTKSKSLSTLQRSEIKGYIDAFVRFTADMSETMPDKRFFVTRVGCGLAGYKDEEIAPYFKMCATNCSFAEAWEPYL